MTTGLAEMTVAGLLDDVAARQPTPGGGGVAAVTTALAAALGEMVVRYRVGKKSAAEHEALHRRAIETLGELRRGATALGDADATAFRRLAALWKLDRDDPDRAAGWDDAVRDAIETPRRVMEAALGTLDVLDGVRETVGRNLASDLAIAALLAQAGTEAAAWNVRINLPSVGDAERAGRLEAEVERALARAGELRRRIESDCRGG